MTSTASSPHDIILLYTDPPIDTNIGVNANNTTSTINATQTTIVSPYLDDAIRAGDAAVRDIRQMYDDFKQVESFVLDLTALQRNLTVEDVEKLERSHMEARSKGREIRGTFEPTFPRQRFKKLLTCSMSSIYLMK